MVSAELAIATAASFAAERFVGDPLLVAAGGDTIGVVAAMTVVVAAGVGFCVAVVVAAAAAAFASSTAAVVVISSPLDADVGIAAPGMEGAWFAAAAVPSDMAPSTGVAAVGVFVALGVAGALVDCVEADAVDVSCAEAVSKDAKSVGGTGAPLLCAIGVSVPSVVGGTGATAGAAGRAADALGVGTAFASALGVA